MEATLQPSDNPPNGDKGNKMENQIINITIETSVKDLQKLDLTEFEALLKAAKIIKRTGLEQVEVAYRCIKGDTVRRYRYVGSGKNTKCHDIYPQKILQKLGIQFTRGNDAPRGGKIGEWVKIA